MQHTLVDRNITRIIVHTLEKSTIQVGITLNDYQHLEKFID